SMFVLPSMTAPAPFSRSTTAASYGDTKLSSIREPQDVFTPAVQKMSLCAIGTPVSGPAVSSARRRSASSASRSASSLVTVMNPFSSPSSFSIRSRQCRVSSTADILRARSASASCAIVKSCMRGEFPMKGPEKACSEKWCQTPFSSPVAAGVVGARKRVSDTIFRHLATPFFGGSFDDLRDEVQAPLDGRGIALIELVHVLFRDDVLSQPLGPIERVRHRLDAVGRHGRKLPDHLDDVRQLRGEIGGLVGADLETGELAELVDVLFREGHGLHR